jgi:hypothetical protein
MEILSLCWNLMVFLQLVLFLAANLVGRAQHVDHRMKEMGGGKEAFKFATCFGQMQQCGGIM